MKFKHLKGKGAFGIVIACYDKQNNNAKVAVKKCINALNVVPWNIIREVECMKHLRGHRNVIELIDVYIEYNSFDKESSDIYIVTELCEKTLWEYLNEKTFPQTPLYEHEVKNFMSQLLSCCVYMHSASIIHRDIKPENLLMKGEILKLIDWGSATMCKEQQTVEHLESVYVVTKCYRPPEVVLTSEEQSPAIDVWSIGCVFAVSFRESNLIELLIHIHVLFVMTIHRNYYFYWKILPQDNPYSM